VKYLAGTVWCKLVRLDSEVLLRDAYLLCLLNEVVCIVMAKISLPW